MFCLIGFLLQRFIPTNDENKSLLGKTLLNGSAYSSENLENWLNSLFCELLPDANPPIKFKDLVLPTYVVATDLSGLRPKIWSTISTPDAVVATAVRSSCSIPLFFEPVESGNNLYVDGGVLSNLPSFVFANNSNNSTTLGGRIIAFQLLEDNPLEPKWTLNWFLGRLVNVVISGATNLQSSIQNNVSTIGIKTGDISGTNFNISDKEISFLLQSGRSAVRDFIKNEHAELYDSIATDIARFSEDELFDDIVREMTTPGKRFIACKLYQSDFPGRTYKYAWKSTFGESHRFNLHWPSATTKIKFHSYFKRRKEKKDPKSG